MSTWSIDPAHTQAEFSVKHMMFTTVRGQFSNVTGTIQLDESDPSDAFVRVNIEASTIDSRNPDRDTHLRGEDFLDVEDNPEITFVSTEVKGDPTAEGGDFTVVGDLTIRGTTKSVELDASYGGTGTDPWGGTRVGFSADTTIDRRDFGLEWNQTLEKGGVLVGHDVKIHLEVQAVKQ